MTAAQLRRLEVEEWDKQRMKNFYLASFGGLRWFDQMEQALHNPLFIESRGWTDPVQVRGGSGGEVVLGWGGVGTGLR